MSICSDDFFKFANNCLINNDEINLRNFISRGYYGLYHLILSKLSYNPNFDKEQHAGLIQYLSNKSMHGDERYDPTKLKSLAYILRQEKLSRGVCDYEITENITMQDVELSQKAHVRFKKIVDEL